MKRVSTFFLRAAIIAIGVIILALCIFGLPAMWSAVSAEYPSYAYAIYYIIGAMYLAAVPFYIALHQAIKLLKYIDNRKAFSLLAVRTLKRIAYAATSISAIFVTSLPFFYIWADKDDAPGLVIIGMFLVLAPFTIAVFAAVMQRLFREAIEIKAENELTV